MTAIATTTGFAEPLTDTEYRRIYALLGRALAAEEQAQATGESGDGLDLEDAVEIVVELYGVDALRAVLTGRSPRA